MWRPLLLIRLAKEAYYMSNAKVKKMSKALSIEVAEPNFNPSERFSDPRLEK